MKPERWVRQTDFSNDEAVGFLADRLNRLGVETRLLQLGAQEGDAVLIGDPDNAVVFDFKPGIDAGAEVLRRRGEDQRFDEPRPAARRRREIDGRTMDDRTEGRDPRPTSPGGLDRAARPTGPTVLRDRLRRRPRPSRRDEDEDDPQRMSDDGRRTQVTVREADRGQGRLVLPHHRGGWHRPRPDPPAWSTCSPSHGAGGAEMVLVSSGAIAAGLAPLGLARRPRGTRRPAGRGVGRPGTARAPLHRGARPHGIVTGQVLLTNDDMTRRSHYRNAYQTFAKLLELGVLPIVNENDTVATSEIRFGDNDRLAALVAHLVHADLLVLLSDVDGLYDGNPADQGISLVAEVVARRRPGARPDRPAPAAPASAPAACRPRSRPPGSPPEQGSPSSSPRPSTRPPRHCTGEPVGTLFHATGRRRPTRLLWLAHATEPKGQARARRRRGPRGDRAPRLAARRRPHRRDRAVRRGRPGRPDRPDGRPVARGLVNFDAQEIPSLLGRSSHDLKRELGAGTSVRSCTGTTWSCSDAR